MAVRVFCGVVVCVALQQAGLAAAEFASIDGVKTTREVVVEGTGATVSAGDKVTVRENPVCIALRHTTLTNFFALRFTRSAR